jgi:hypothetical protein
MFSLKTFLYSINQSIVYCKSHNTIRFSIHILIEFFSRDSFLPKIDNESTI